MWQEDKEKEAKERLLTGLKAIGAILMLAALVAAIFPGQMVLATAFLVTGILCMLTSVYQEPTARKIRVRTEDEADRR